jgi:hypothetical protein
MYKYDVTYTFLWFSLCIAGGMKDGTNSNERNKLYDPFFIVLFHGFCCLYAIDLVEGNSHYLLEYWKLDQERKAKPGLKA